MSLDSDEDDMKELLRDPLESPRNSCVKASSRKSSYQVKVHVIVHAQLLLSFHCNCDIIDTTDPDVEPEHERTSCDHKEGRSLDLRPAESPSAGRQ